MLSMARLAFESDSTRIITLMVDAVATPPFKLHPDQNTTDGYHNLSHHGQSETKVQQLIDAAAGAGAPEALVSTHVPAMAAVSASADLDLGTLDVPMYSIDAVLRRSPALQQTSIAERSRTAGGQG